MLFVLQPPISMEPTEEALKAATIDPNVEPEYNVGDMLWAKVGGHPFWACMVSRDPFDHLYWKQRGEYLVSKDFELPVYSKGANVDCGNLRPYFDAVEPFPQPTRGLSNVFVWKSEGFHVWWTRTVQRTVATFLL